MSLVLSPSAWVYFSKAPRNLALRRVFFDFSFCFARCLHNAALRVSEPDLPFCWGMNFRGAAWLETSPRQAKTNWYTMKSSPSHLQKRRTVQGHVKENKWKQEQHHIEQPWGLGLLLLSSSLLPHVPWQNRERTGGRLFDMSSKVICRWTFWICM